MPTDTKYEGWSNRETWCVSLWLANEESLYRDTTDLARDTVRYAVRCYEDGHVRDPDVQDDAAQIRVNAAERLADNLKKFVDNLPELEGTGLAGDLLTFALARVDWREIAENMLAGLELTPVVEDGAAYTYEWSL